MMNKLTYFDPLWKIKLRIWDWHVGLNLDIFMILNKFLNLYI